jgi:Uma2 family endonuclease
MEDDRIGPGSAGLRMKPEAFDAIPASGFVRGCRYEIIDGVLVVSPFPGPGERSLNDYVGYLLTQHFETPADRPVDADTLPEQTIATTNRRRADRAIWVGLDRKPDEQADVPAIVIEFVSSRRRDAYRDYEEKREEYLAAGVKEYWVIDRFRRIMTVYKARKSRKSSRPTYDIVTETGSYETPLLPGFSLPLARLLEKADQWRRPRKRSAPDAPAGGTDG